MLPSDRFIFLLIMLIPIVTTSNCDNLLVKTDSGYVRGVPLRTLLTNKEYFAYRGIPYAEPPVGNLRFKVPVPISPWQGILKAYNYSYSCLVIDQSTLFPLNTTQSEDCLHLNIFTPVTRADKVKAKKAVMFFIHGGAFTEGDGTNGFYGADFIVENDVLLVTFDYRLGPWGFASFDIKGFTGNMGFKDQQLALEWIHKNIKYFGGDPNKITIFGESAGGTSVHLQVLSQKSRKLMKRAIAMSGTALAPFAHYEPNSHVELFKQIFDLDPQATGKDVLDFMSKDSSKELILQKSPVLFLNRSVVGLYFSAVIEDEEKAENPFLTQGPQEIYRTTKVDVDTMFGVNTAEYSVVFNPAEPYSWLEPLKNNYSNIGLPFSGLTLSPESSLYQEAIKKIYDFYFGAQKLEDLEANVKNVNNYIQMGSDMNLVYSAHQSLKLHSKQARTFCYENNLNLSLNAVKITENIEYLDGTAHFEDLFYLFRSKKYAQLYNNVLANPNDPINQKTLKALKFVPKMFTDYAKWGFVSHYGPFTEIWNSCIKITNDGLKPMNGLKKESMRLWDSIYNSVKPWIVNPF